MKFDLQKLFSGGLNGSDYNVILGKARRTGSSWSSTQILNWYKYYKSYNQVQRRKDKIKKVFNI